MKVERIKSRINKARARYERKGHERLLMPFTKFVMLMPYMTKQSIDTLVAIPPPHTFAGVAVPQSLQMETFGTLTQLQGSAKDDDYLKTCCGLVSVLTGVKSAKVATMPAIEVLGIVNMVQSEMERISKLFQSLNTDKTSDELSAGIEKLNFGAFGIVDWYAQRMGIIDHEEVFKTPWARIYQCMKIDHENNEFEKRYRRIIEQRSKRK